MLVNLPSTPHLHKLRSMSLDQRWANNAHGPNLGGYFYMVRGHLKLHKTPLWAWGLNRVSPSTSCPCSALALALTIAQGWLWLQLHDRDSAVGQCQALSSRISLQVLVTCWTPHSTHILSPPALKIQALHSLTISGSFLRRMPLAEGDWAQSQTITLDGPPRETGGGVDFLLWYISTP